MNISYNIKIKYFLLLFLGMNSTYSIADDVIPIFVNGIPIFVPDPKSSPPIVKPEAKPAATNVPALVTSNEPLIASKHTKVGDGLHMESEVTVYRNGKIVSSTKSWSKNFVHGLRNHSMFAVISDSQGNAIWVTKAYTMRTVSGTGDIGGHSQRTDTNQDNAPIAIGKYAYSIRIYHDSGSLSSIRNTMKNAIKDTIVITNELKKAQEKLK